MLGIAVLSSLALAGIAIFSAVVWRRAIRRGDQVPTSTTHVLRLDAMSAATSWGLGQGLLALSISAGLLRLAPLLWLFAGLAIGLVALVIFWWKLRQARLGGVRASSQAYGRRESTSETWQYALIAAGSAAFGSYLIGIGRLHPQLLHIGITLMAALTGYALGLAIWSPKTKPGATVGTTPEETRTSACRSCSTSRGRGRRARR